MEKSSLKSVLMQANDIFCNKYKEDLQNLIPNKAVSHVLQSTCPPLLFVKK
jgi:hypothetical protein